MALELEPVRAPCVPVACREDLGERPRVAVREYAAALRPRRRKGVHRDGVVCRQVETDPAVGAWFDPLDELEGVAVPNRKLGPICDPKSVAVVEREVPHSGGEDPLNAGVSCAGRQRRQRVQRSGRCEL